MLYLNSFSFFFRKQQRCPDAQIQRYANSELVRQWLVLLALSSGKLNVDDEFKQRLAQAFSRVREGVRSGQVALDYRPADNQTLDMPKVSHPYYMQAVLYWSTRLDCNPAVFAEMHSLLGTSPSFEDATSTARQIQRGDRIPQSSSTRRSGRDTAQAFMATSVGMAH
ncbi:MAG: hypothetical protein V4614_03685 [Pseudomonadota bacterium]